VITKECNGSPKSTVHICCRVPAAIFWSSAPTLAKPTQSVSSVIAMEKKKKKKKKLLTFSSANVSSHSTLKNISSTSTFKEA
jgi:hypothetical protein